MRNYLEAARQFLSQCVGGVDGLYGWLNRVGAKGCGDERLLKLSGRGKVGLTASQA